MLEVAATVGLTDIGYEPYLFRIEDIVAAVEDLGSFLGELQQIPQRRNRTVMQIGSSGPDPIQGLTGVAVGFAPMAEAVGKAGVECRLIDGQVVSVVVQTIGVGADGLERDDGPDSRASEVVAISALLLVDGFSLVR